MDFASKSDWPGYFQAVLGKPPRETLVKALELFDKDPAPTQPRLAIDLACGEGRDTLELLRRGWRVMAMDGHEAGIQLLRERVPAEYSRLLERCEVADFAAARWPMCDLLNCSFALPFCPPDLLPDLWQRIVESIRPGGRFAGQIFGERDTWARCGKTTGIPRSEVDRMFAAFIFEELREEEKDDVTTMGEAKHWHVFHIVARRLG